MKTLFLSGSAITFGYKFTLNFSPKTECKRGLRFSFISVFSAMMLYVCSVSFNLIPNVYSGNLVSETFPELLKLLEELEKEGKFVDIQICTRCKSARVERVRTMEGDMSSHLTITPIKYECLDRGWRERLVLKATNRPLGFKEIALIAEALNFKEHAKQLR